MTSQPSSYVAKLFYSYSHKDSRHRHKMEKSLFVLKGAGLLHDWSDESILPGQNISAEIDAQLDTSNIIVFLLSPDFLASKGCMYEWERAKTLAQGNAPIFRIPIVVRPCAWKDLLGEDDLLALPTDGQPVVSFADPDEAWLQIYEGIKLVAEQLRATFSPKDDFLATLEHTDFISEGHIDLSDTFVFLPLAERGRQDDSIRSPKQRISTADQLLQRNHAIIHGDDRSGKTALTRHLALLLVQSAQPVILVDLKQMPTNAGLNFLKRTYHSQFHGDFDLWRQQPTKTLIVDNLSDRPDTLNFLTTAAELFERILIATSSNIYFAYYRDEARLASYHEIEILPLTHSIQESLIRKRLYLTTDGKEPMDGLVDQIEERINTVIINNHIVPRYPFYVLCILQTYEAFMPTGLSISSYGHCYQALIVAGLIRAGISRQDSDINACLNFAEHLARSLYLHREAEQEEAFAFQSFVDSYGDQYHMPRSMVSRLTAPEFGLLNVDGSFRTEYMYYFFLGRHLAKGDREQRETIAHMCDATYIDANYLTLLFTIHHTNDEEIIDEILLRTMTALGDVDVAKLDKDETRRFQELATGLQGDFLSRESVGSERRKEREARDHASEWEEEDGGRSIEDVRDEDAKSTGIYRVWKNNEVMGQILRNKYGNITKQKIEEIVSIMTDGGLRLVNVILKDEEEIQKIAQFLRTKNPEYKVEQILRDLRSFAFVWTMLNVEHLVKSVNVPEIAESVVTVMREANTPACDLIGYFVLLDAALELTTRERDALAEILKQHDDPFVKGVLSMRTQRYMNTHRSRGSVEQSVCSLLGIRYTARIVSDNA